MEQLTGVNAETVKTAMRDSFDYHYPWRKGWNLKDDEKRRAWRKYRLAEIYQDGKDLTETDLRNMLTLLGVWAKGD